jgi:type IV pilus assembly protein PilW
MKQMKKIQARGFSLVELMIAILLGALITTGIIQMFSSNQRNYQMLTGQSRLQESGRFALDFMTQPVRMAGYSGCYSETGEARSVLNGATPPFEYDMTVTMQAYEATSTTPATWSPVLDTLPTGANGIDTAQIAPGTDVLVVRAGSFDYLQLVQSQATGNGDIITQIPADPTQYDIGAILLVSDCTKAALFQVTNNAAGGGQFRIQHSTGGGVVPGNATADLSGNGTVFDVDSELYRIETTVFFIAPSTGVNNVGVTPLSLWQKVGENAPVELVDGVENLQVIFGVDTDGDEAPNRYQTFQSVIDPADIVTVRVQVTVNSVDVVADQGDGLLRRTFSKTIAIRNRV